MDKDKMRKRPTGLEGVREIDKHLFEKKKKLKISIFLTESSQINSTA